MVLPNVAGSPRTGAEVVGELHRIHRESSEYWSGYDLQAFFARPTPEIWAPVDQVRHLSTAMRAITLGFRVPKLVLWFRYGRATRPSREYHKFRATYDAALARGARAGPFAPRQLSAADHTQAKRDAYMRLHATAVTQLTHAIGNWSESSLDRLQLPHPLLGKITAREMALFALIHNVHHVHVAERRRRG